MKNNKDDKIKITKAEMEAYENCRQSGITNMFDIKKVKKLTGWMKIKLCIL